MINTIIFNKSIDKDNNDTITIAHRNGVVIGDFLRHEDGYWYLWINTSLSGCFAEQSIKEIYNKLALLNSEMNYD